MVGVVAAGASFAPAMVGIGDVWPGESRAKEPRHQPENPHAADGVPTR